MSSSKISKIKLKRCDKGQCFESKLLARISCKIGDHFVNAYINTGSSISIASTDLYRKLVADQFTFKEGKCTLNLIDESLPNQLCLITKTSVKVIGQTKSINLVAFPNNFTPNTTLGIDFLNTKSDKKSKEMEVFRVPEIPVLKKQNSVHSEDKDDKKESDDLLDWILDPTNLKKPLYNILADGTADDEDLFAICAFMKRLPRMVSPIRSLEKSSNEKVVDINLVSESRDKTSIEPVTSSSTPNNSSFKSKPIPSATNTSSSTLKILSSISKPSSSTSKPPSPTPKPSSSTPKPSSSTPKPSSSTSKVSPSTLKRTSSTSKTSSYASKTSSYASKTLSSTSKTSSSSSKTSSSTSKTSSPTSKRNRN